MAYSINAITDNCYEGTTCLINKLNIRDENLLTETESAITLAKASLLDHQPLSGEYDFAHYRQMHHFLFCDLYDWAGEIRTINLSKKGTVFVAAEELETCAAACFERLVKADFATMNHIDVAVEIADLYNSVNMLHPFREGNGRTQRIFFTQWIRHLGYDIDLSVADIDLFMVATIHAAQGVMDDLIAFFETMLIDPYPTLDFHHFP
jgi:cell filamentation protein